MTTHQPPWLALARAEIGTAEHPGPRSNPRIVGYFRDAGFPGIHDEATPWCAAFVGAMLHRAGHKPSGSLMARSYERWGIALARPVLGCVATKHRAGGPGFGHTGFVVGANAHEVFLLGGNQRDACTIAVIPRGEIRAFRWPAGVPVPAASGLPTTISGARAGASEA